MIRTTRKPPLIPPKESVLHTHVAATLRDWCKPDWRWCHVNNKAKDAREGAIMKRMGVTPGIPDFILFSPFHDRPCHGLELKRVGGKLRPEQEAWRDWALAYGWHYEVAETLGQALTALNSWGCLRLEMSW